MLYPFSISIFTTPLSHSLDDQGVLLLGPIKVAGQEMMFILTRKENVYHQAMQENRALIDMKGMYQKAALFRTRAE